MYSELTVEQLLAQAEDMRDWGRFVGFCGRDEQDRYASCSSQLQAEFNRRGYLYPGMRCDLQPANCIALEVGQ